MNEIKYYDLNQSQDVVKLQCKYTLFKRIINILSSMSTDEELDFELMKKAFNLVVARNDCLRIQFVKDGKELKQYFRKECKFDNIPVLTFKTEQEQLDFVEQQRKKAIKYLKGDVIEPYFIKTFDNRYMVFLKVCHLILDIYGINIIYKDLFEVYDALKNGTPLPKAPENFEDVVSQDLVRKNNTELQKKNFEFFEDYLQNHEEPSYAGVHGDKNPIWQKQIAKNKKKMKMFFLSNRTIGYQHNINTATTEKCINLCKEIKQTPATFFFYVSSLCASKLNNNTKKMLPLELCNCRSTPLAKQCAGTKVQSVACYTEVKQEKTFKENFEDFCELHAKVFRRIGYSDPEFEALLRKTYHSSLLETYYSITFSFIPYVKPEKFRFDMYSNGRSVLPAYLALLYDVQKGDIEMVYDVQTKITTEQDVEKFHKTYIEILNQVADNPDILIKDIKI